MQCGRLGDDGRVIACMVTPPSL